MNIVHKNGRDYPQTQCSYIATEIDKQNSDSEENINGSIEAIAGITNKKKNIGFYTGGPIKYTKFFVRF